VLDDIYSYIIIFMQWVHSQYINYTLMFNSHESNHDLNLWTEASRWGAERQWVWLRERLHEVTIWQHTVKRNKITYGSLWKGRVAAFIVVFYLHGLAFSVHRRRMNILSAEIPSFSTNWRRLKNVPIWRRKRNVSNSSTFNCELCRMFRC
jgi:hypothetical protein